MCFHSLIAVLLILVCPCALCYGQLSFSGVNGEKGYAALRGKYKLDLDNGLIITPDYGYYRRTDKEEDEAGSTSRYGLQVAYETGDSSSLLVYGRWVPTTLGFQSVSYGAGAQWQPFYRYGILKEPALKLRVGQTRYDVYRDALDRPLPGGKASITETFAHGLLKKKKKNWRLQGVYEKVIKYSSQPAAGMVANWADIPFMVAVIRGFVKESAGAHVSYPTRWITPYASWVRYKYAGARDFAVAVSAGLALHFWDMDFTGGVEIFEPKRADSRRTYFSMSIEAKF